MNSFFCIFTLIALVFGNIFTLWKLLTSKKITDSLLYLIFIFLFVFGLLLFINVEFLAISFLIIYVGAVAILLVFTLMVTVRTEEQSPAILNPGVLITGFLIILFFFTVGYQLLDRQSYLYLNTLYIESTVFQRDYALALVSEISDVSLISTQLYTRHRALLFINGFLLFCTVVGVLALALPSQQFTKVITDKIKSWGGRS